ncbi:MAG: hypothetical protein J2P57_15680 [Acidimicrobiaceae bacterium]|nr:hypothetical protein [Acidimicrobiaceae bacterium]
MTTYREALEAWLREPLPADQRERAMEEAVRTMVKAGLAGNLTWAQVADAMTGLRYVEEDQQEGDPGDGLGPTVERGAALSEEEKVAAEGMAEAAYRMTMEVQDAHEHDLAAREEAGLEVERDVEAER